MTVTGGGNDGIRVGVSVLVVKGITAMGQAGICLAWRSGYPLPEMAGAGAGLLPAPAFLLPASGRVSRPAGYSLPLNWVVMGWWPAWSA